ILLGKNFLKNRFIVDVAQKNVHGTGGQDSMLVLTAFPAETSEFLSQVRRSGKHDVTYDCMGFDGLSYYIDGEKTKVTIDNDGLRDIADYRLTFFKNHHNREFAYAAAEYLHYR